MRSLLSSMNPREKQLGKGRLSHQGRTGLRGIPCTLRVVTRFEPGTSTVVIYGGQIGDYSLPAVRVGAPASEGTSSSV